MESPEILNKRLVETYGYFDTTNLPKFRLVRSEDQIVNQLDTYVDYLEGTNIFLREVTEFRNVKKYPHINPHKWILEICVAVNSDQLTTKTSYECLWAFGLKGDPYGEPIDPKWIAIEFLIQNLLKKLGKHTYAQYKPEKHEEQTLEAQELRINELMEALYGGTDKVGDAIATKNAVVLNDRSMEIKS